MKTSGCALVLAGLVLGVCAPAQQHAAGVKSATFAARNEFKITVPPGAKKVRAWLAYPQQDPNQDLKDVKVECPFKTRVEKDSEGNEVLYVEVENPTVKDFTVVETFTITRREQRSGVDAAKSHPMSADETTKNAAWTKPNVNVVMSDEIKTLAAKITAGDKNPVSAARKLYDWELDNVEYWVKNPALLKASPVGSSEYCLKTKTGNCTDFHSLWTALARSSGIPTKMVYGSFFKAELDGKDKDQSYHCWPEFYAPGFGWVPHDVAVADIFAGDIKITPDNDEKVRLTTADGYKGPDAAKVNYYFGNIDERRVVWSRGRDLTLSPKQDGPAVNALPKAYMEVDGKPVPEKDNWSRKLTFTEMKAK